MDALLELVKTAISLACASGREDPRGREGDSSPVGVVREAGGAALSEWLGGLYCEEAGLSVQGAQECQAPAGISGEAGCPERSRVLVCMLGRLKKKLGVYRRVTWRRELSMWLVG